MDHEFKASPKILAHKQNKTKQKELGLASPKARVQSLVQKGQKKKKVCHYV
jgi:hypothetical protein